MRMQVSRNNNHPVSDPNIEGSRSSNRAARTLLRLASFALVFYIGFVYRATTINSFPGNRDVMGHLAQVTNRTSAIKLIDKYDFTAGLGSRTLDRANLLNPFSLVPYLAGAVNGLWLSQVAFAVTILATLSVLTRKWQFPRGVGHAATMLVLIWTVNPSSLRIGKLTEFGGHELMFVALASLIVLAILPSSQSVRVSRWDLFVGFVGLTLAFIASALGQPLLIWAYAVVTLGHGFALIMDTGLLAGTRFIVTRAGYGAAALLLSSIVAGSPILTVLSSANSRAGTYRGVGDDGSSVWVLWASLGATPIVRVLILIFILGGLYTFRRKITPAQRQWLVSAALSSATLQVYSILFYGLFQFAIEIGPRPHYLTEMLFVPILGCVFGLVLVRAVTFVGEFLQSRRFPLSPNVIVAFSVLVLPFLGLTAWSMKNPDVFEVGRNPRARPPSPLQLSEDPRLQSLGEARVLVVEPGEELIPDQYHPSTLFAFAHNRNRSESVVVFTLHSTEVSRWQHWLFESEGANFGRNSAVFLWARSYRPELAASVQATHVLSDKPITDKFLKLVRQDYMNGISYLYSFTRSSRTLGSAITQIKERDPEIGTRLAVSRSLEQIEVLVVPEIQPNLIGPSKVSFQTRWDQVAIEFSSSGSSIAVLPFEYSSCHNVNLTSGEQSSVRLIPVNGRFLGVLFTGQIEGVLTYQSAGPLGLWCQIRDFWETRSIG